MNEMLQHGYLRLNLNEKAAENKQDDHDGYIVIIPFLVFLTNCLCFFVECLYTMIVKTVTKVLCRITK